MELVFRGNRSYINYMRNHFLHEEGLNLMPVAKTIHIDEDEREDTAKSYTLRYEDHTEKTRKYEGGHKTIIKTKIPQDLIRWVEKNIKEIQVDRAEGTVEMPEAIKMYLDPKYDIFLDNKHPKLKRELVAIVIVLSTGSDFPITYEELLVQSSKNKSSVFADYIIFKTVRSWKDWLIKFFLN